MLFRSEVIMTICENSNGKFIIHDPVPREILLQQLANMDFLINLLLEGTEKKQVPSKLIDYALSGRPILNIDPLNPDKGLITEFLRFDFTHAYQVQNIEQYNIKNVVSEFTKLVKQ